MLSMGIVVVMRAVVFIFVFIVVVVDVDVDVVVGLYYDYYVFLTIVVYIALPFLALPCDIHCGSQNTRENLAINYRLINAC